MTANRINELATLLSSYSNSYPHLECDDLSQVFHQVLSDEGVAHTTFAGVVTHVSEGTTPFHVWIDLDSGLRIDYRLQRWLGASSDISHGIFDPKELTAVCYKGNIVEMPALSGAMIDQLLKPVSVSKSERSY